MTAREARVELLAAKRDASRAATEYARCPRDQNPARGGEYQRAALRLHRARQAYAKITKRLAP